MKLNETLDGEVWAREFVAKVKAGTLDPTRMEDVVPWFQNAIMTGVDRAMPVNGDGLASVSRERGSVN